MPEAWIFMVAVFWMVELWAARFLYLTLTPCHAKTLASSNSLKTAKRLSHEGGAETSNVFLRP